MTTTYYRVMHWMILDDFLRCVFDGSFKKVVQNWKESPILSLSPHKKKRANKHHHHQMEVADIAIAPLKEFVRDSARLVKKCTKPDRREFTLIASKTAFGASSRSSSSSSSSLSFFVCPLPPFLSIFWGKSNTYIYIATLSRFGSHQKTFSLHLLQNTTTGFIMFGFVGFFVKLVL